MFKRVEKRRKRREEEEELGLDEDMKDLLGMHDTDSDESDSEAGSSEDGTLDQKDSDDGEEGQDVVREEQGRKRKRDTKSGEEDEEAEEEDTGSNGEKDEEDLKRRTLTVQEALEDTLYVIAARQPHVKGCIICPGKLLKNVQMSNVHKASKACTSLYPLYLVFCSPSICYTERRLTRDASSFSPNSQRKHSQMKALGIFCRVTLHYKTPMPRPLPEKLRTGQKNA